MRVVLDTNVMVSFLFDPEGDLAATIGHILAQHTPLQSAETTSELRDVLQRPKIRRYVSEAKAVEFLAQLNEFSEQVEIAQPIVACRDPKDDKFLSLAVAAGADCIVSGDDDLLSMNSFRGIPILAVSEFRRRYAASR
jgi:uncharacterized protein